MKKFRVTFRCFDCKDILVSNLLIGERGKDDVTCGCGASYAVSGYKNGNATVHRTNRVPSKLTK